MSGYTFIDNSELSVGEKIKKYFEKKQTASMDSSYSSTSSGSVDLDASFQKVLVARKLELTTRNQPVHAYLSDETIDLCSPPVGMSPTETIRTAIESNKNNRRKTVNLISFSDSSEDLEQVRDVITTHPKSYLIEDYSFNNSYNESWCKISDDTFERDEAMCASMLQDTDETQIIDVEAPSSLWEQSIFPMDDSVTKWKCVASGRRLPSTILEESTINSETSRESAQYQSDALTKNPTSNCVLLKPIVLPSNCAPKIKTISSSNSKLLENVQPTTSKSYYRPSMMNVFPLPGKKKRNFFFTDSPVLSEELLQSKSPRTPVHQLMSPIEQSPVVSIQTSNFKRKPLLTSPIQKIIPKPSAEPFELLTYPESSPASPFDDENISATSSNQLSPAQPEFNDTLEVNINLL